MPIRRTHVPAPGPHGGDGPSIASALGFHPAEILDLSQSLNPFAPDVSAIVREAAGAVGHYPDAGHATDVLALTLGVDPSRLLITNGGSEAIDLVAREIGGGVLAEPEFGLHPRSSDGPRWRSDPHNPTGVLAEPGMVADVWDEAFYALATGRWSAHRPGVTVGSLTKTFACPGLRLGYVIADDVERFARHQPTWSVSSLALAALPRLLEAAELEAWRDGIGRLRSAVVEVFHQRGFSVEVADAPWVLVEAPGLRDRLAPSGILVRDCASFGMPGTMRVAVPGDAGLERLATALDQTG